MRPAVDFIYSGIRVRNLPRSIRFYRKLGFRVLRRGSFSHGGRYVHLVFPGSSHRLELNYYPRGSRFYEPPVPGQEFDHFGFRARDPGAWLRMVRRAGARFALGYTDRPQQQLYFVRDPDGVWIGVFGPIVSRPTQFPARAPRRRPAPAAKARRRRRRRRSLDPLHPGLKQRHLTSGPHETRAT